MIRVKAILSFNDVMGINEDLKEIGIGGVTVDKERGRGKTPPPEVHAGKGRAVFTPQFSQKYVIQLIVPKNKEEKVVEIIRKNSRRGKIVIEPISRAVDIATGKEGEEVI